MFLGFFLILILSLRNIDTGYTDTRLVYYEAFNRFKNMNSIIGAITDAHFRSEPLMAIYLYLGAKEILNFQLFLTVTAIISILPILYLVKNEKMAYFSLLYFFSFYYFFYFYLIKQMLALAIVIFSFNCIKEKKWKKYLILCFVASLVHKFAWPCIIAYPLCRFIKFKKSTYMIIALIIAGGILFSETLLELIIKIDPTKLMVSYIYIYGRNTRLNFGLVLNMLILVFCAMMRRRVKEYKEEYNILLILSSINCIFNSYSLIITEFQRLAFFFGIYNAILFPRALEVIPLNKSNKKLFVTVITGLMIIYGLGRTAVNTKCIPYDFFWNNRI